MQQLSKLKSKMTVMMNRVAGWCGDTAGAVSEMATPHRIAGHPNDELY